MKVLVVGSGGREHALVWKLAQSPRVTEIFCAPGNGGIAAMAQCVPVAAEDMAGLLDFATTQGIDLTVVGPEVSLALGIVDLFQAAGLRIFGPDKKAAALEGSKVFMKNLLAKYHIPSAQFASFTDRQQALAYIEKIGAPLVVKADGLAAGKGVIVCQHLDEARAAIDLVMTERAFGDAGNQVIIEEFLPGEEASFIAFTDGTTVLPLPTSQDHKAVYDGDTGPNTGGMGAYSPAPVVTPALHAQVMTEVMMATVKALEAEGCPYKGMLYAGLMIRDGEAKVLEFNCRFGDPEAQPLLMRLNNDLVEVMEAVIDGTLAAITLDIDPRPTVCVVMASGGYPGVYAKGHVISGLEAAGRQKDVMVFHAGTTAKDGVLTNSGGRVLGVTAIDADLATAIAKAYGAVEMIHWQDCYFRRDIGQKALRRGETL
jgi:phosphoribosylamine--glycine ligase